MWWNSFRDAVDVFLASAWSFLNTAKTYSSFCNNPSLLLYNTSLQRCLLQNVSSSERYRSFTTKSEECHCSQVRPWRQIIRWMTIITNTRLSLESPNRFQQKTILSFSFSHNNNDTTDSKIDTKYIIPDLHYEEEDDEHEKHHRNYHAMKHHYWNDMGTNCHLFGKDLHWLWDFFHGPETAENTIGAIGH